MIVEVFRTTVNHEHTARQLVHQLQGLFPHASINFDLEDCDKILRICGGCNPDAVASVLNQSGFECSPLE